MKKSEIEHHSDGYRASRPAVNVKMHTYLRNVKLPLNTGGVADPIYKDGVIVGHTPVIWQYTEAGFTHRWIEQHLTDSEVWDTWMQIAANDGWEMLGEQAQEIFGAHVKVWSEGRSGGWAVVDGLDDFDTWDAIMVSKWSRFAKVARTITDDVPHQTMMLIYINVYEPLIIERDQALHDLDVPDAALATSASKRLAAALAELEGEDEA